MLIDEAHQRGATCQVIVSTAWGCPYEGDVPVERVVRVAARAVADGADSISFGDTTGMATPGRVRALVGGVPLGSSRAGLNLHFHNTRGTGLANVLTALELGVADFDASVGGLGGCPYAPGATGNIATEELVYMVEDMGVATGIDLEAMIDAAADAERIIGKKLPSQVLRPAPANPDHPGLAPGAPPYPGAPRPALAPRPSPASRARSGPCAMRSPRARLPRPALAPGPAPCAHPAPVSRVPRSLRALRHALAPRSPYLRNPHAPRLPPAPCAPRKGLGPSRRP